MCDPDKLEVESPDATPLREGEGRQLVGVHGLQDDGTTQDHPSNPGDRTGIG